MNNVLKEKVLNTFLKQTYSKKNVNILSTQHHFIMCAVSTDKSNQKQSTNSSQQKGIQVLLVFVQIVSIYIQGDEKCTFVM